MNIQKALAHLGFKPEDYILENDDFSMVVKTEERLVLGITETVDVTPSKPTEEQMIVADQEVRLKDCDIVLLINEYLKDKQRDLENDSMNISNGLIYSWNFTHVTCPTRDQLLALVDVTIAKRDQAVINVEALAYLKATDFYIIREIDSGISCPIEVRIARAQARAKIIR